MARASSKVGRPSAGQAHSGKHWRAGAAVRWVLIGVELGPNLSVTGTLATIPRLTALRGDGLGAPAAGDF